MSHTPKVDAVVTVDVNDVLEENFLGVGAHFSPYDAYEISTSDFQLVCQRLDHMGLPLTRVMLMAHWYCKGLDDAGEPIYDRDSWLMKLLYKNLDWCEKNNTTVMIGEWGGPLRRTGMKGLRDPRLARLVADSVEHLLDKKGYTCIKYYNLINEPQGSWSSTRGDWDLWRSVIINLHREFVARGLGKRIGIAVPDAGGEWTFRALDDDRLRALAGVYEEHWYLMNRSILNGDMEKETRKRMAAIGEKDPGKSFFLGECGLHDDLDHVHDQQRHVFDFWYGVSMTDLAIQLIRGGGAGMVVWVLDDAMHQKSSPHRKREDDPYPNAGRKVEHVAETGPKSGPEGPDFGTDGPEDSATRTPSRDATLPRTSSSTGCPSNPRTRGPRAPRQGSQASPLPGQEDTWASRQGAA